MVLCRARGGADDGAWDEIVGRFHRALYDDGFLLVGPRGIPPARARSFAPVDARHSLFSAVAVCQQSDGWPAEGASIGPVLARDDELSREEILAGMRMLHERLELAYAELHATNEELAFTNAELGAADEETEAIAQELRSTQEDLWVAGDQLARGQHVLQAALTRGAVALVGMDLAVRLWSPGAEALWGAASDDVCGTAFATLDIGLPVAELAGTLAETVRSGAGRTVVVDAVDASARAMRCRVTVVPLGPVGRPEAVSVLMEPVASEPS
jgi:hypothetical protein